MDTNNERPTPEDKRNAAPMDPEGRARMDAALGAIRPAVLAAMSSLTSAASAAAFANSKALEIQSIRDEAPHLLEGITPERAIAGVAECIMDAAILHAKRHGIPDAAIAYAFEVAAKSFPPSATRAVAELEAAIANLAGNPAPTKPNLDLSNLI